MWVVVGRGDGGGGGQLLLVHTRILTCNYRYENCQIRYLDICVCYKKNKSVDIGEKLFSVRFESLNKAHKHYKYCIFRSAHLWLHPLGWLCVDAIPLHMLDLMYVRVVICTAYVQLLLALRPRRVSRELLFMNFVRSNAKF